MRTHLFLRAAELADDDRHEPREPQTDDDLLPYAREVTDEHIERANRAHDAWLATRDEMDAQQAAARAAHGGDADARP